jgi:hypothetical protein
MGLLGFVCVVGCGAMVPGHLTRRCLCCGPRETTEASGLFVPGSLLSFAAWGAHWRMWIMALDELAPGQCLHGECLGFVSWYEAPALVAALSSRVNIEQVGL